MQKRAPAFTKNGSGNNGAACHSATGYGAARAVNGLSTKELARSVQDWLFDCQFQQHSSRTIEFRQHCGDKLIWFLQRQGYDVCGVSELRQFLAHVANGHQEAGGRWGNPKMTNPVRPATVHRYYRELRTLFSWIVRERVIESSPVECISPPQLKSEQIQPFTPEQTEALLRAARRSTHPRRDEAIVLLLLDTGLRASELCSLRMCDIDIQGRRGTVVGKGNKRRTIYFGRTAAKALWQYLREQPRDGDERIFVADRGHRAGEPLTRMGILRLIERLGKAAKIQASRCSPHTFRHTFAVEFLRAGGNVFSLKELLGHSGLQMTNRYVALAQADIENQHRQFSPADRIKRSCK